jgi:paraquat-inducible protein A
VEQRNTTNQFEHTPTRDGLGVVACHECDALQSNPVLAPGDLLVCSRCGAHLRRARGDALHRVLPLTLGACVLFVLANAAPIVSIEAAGNQSATSLLGTVIGLYGQGFPSLALIVALTAFVIPGAELALLAYALSILAVRSGAGKLWASANASAHPLPNSVATVLSTLAVLRPWAMVEIFMLGVLVSLAKLAGLARVIPGVGLWSLCGVIILTAAAHATLDVRGLWETIEARR